MELHLGVIRDREEIYSALVQSHSTKRQLAVCFDYEEKLLVRICTVFDIVHSRDGAVYVSLRSQPDNSDGDIIVELHRIKSIYPIRDFLP